LVPVSRNAGGGAPPVPAEKNVSIFFVSHSLSRARWPPVFLLLILRRERTPNGAHIIFIQSRGTKITQTFIYKTNIKIFV